MKALFVAVCAALMCSVPAVSAAGDALTPIAKTYGAGLTGFKAVIDQLMKKDAAGSTPAQLTAWVTQLQKDVTAMNSAFVSANQQLGVENGRLNKLTTDLAAQTGAIQKDVAAKTKAVAAAQASVNAANQAVALNTRNVANAEANLASTTRALGAANEKLRKAREDCFRRRRKRSWWTDVRDTITRPDKIIKKVICRTIDVITNSVNHAKSARNNAENARNAARNALTASKAQQAAANKQLAATKAAVTAAQAQVAQTQALLTQTKARLTATTDMAASVKAVIEQTDSVTVGSGKLKEFVGDMELLLVSVDVLLVPLNHISDQLTAQNAGVALTKLPVLTAAQKTQITANLQHLKKILA